MTVTVAILAATMSVGSVPPAGAEGVRPDLLPSWSIQVPYSIETLEYSYVKSNGLMNCATVWFAVFDGETYGAASNPPNPAFRHVYLQPANGDPPTPGQFFSNVQALQTYINPFGNRFPDMNGVSQTVAEGQMFAYPLGQYSEFDQVPGDPNYCNGGVEPTLTLEQVQAAVLWTIEPVDVEDPFLWSMEPRFEPDALGDLPFRWTRNEINPDEFRIIAVLKDELCGDDISLEVGVAQLEIVERDNCRMEFDLPEGEFDVEVLSGGNSLGAVEVIVDDILFVVIGDSMLSGEGLGAPGEWTGPITNCHRAAETAGTIAAQRIEEESDATSVTYVNLACSGASLEEGLLDSQLLLSTGEINQLDLMAELIDREVDALVMSAGANDLAFGPILQWCALIGGPAQADCQSLGFQHVTSKEAVELGVGVTSGAQLVEDFTTSICEDINPGDRQISLESSVLEDDNARLFRLDPRGWTINVNPGMWLYSPDDDPDGPAQFARLDVRKRESTSGGPCGVAGVGTTYSVSTAPLTLPRRLPTGMLPAIEEGANDGTEIQPLAPEALIIPPRLEDWIEIAADDLADRFGMLSTRLGAFDIEEVFITEYPDTLTDQAGALCVGILDPPGSADGISRDEAAWARYYFLQRLNSRVRATESLGWTVVGGIQEAFEGHGYCADTSRWVTTLADSLLLQGDVFGTMHPNLSGHEFIAEQLVGTIRGVLVSTAPVPYEGYESPPQSYLQDVARPGQWRLEAVSDAFDVGDFIIIGPGTPNQETNRVGGFGSLVLTSPLENRHPAGTVVMAIDQQDAASIQAFPDVPPGSWFADSVAWAQAGDITTGTTPFTFSPNDDLTRAQLITLLWRALGSPDSHADVPFVDMVPGAYWEEAVRWAFETGVTTGVSPTRFGPDQAGSRAQVATLLWRMAGSPQATSENPFGDIARGRFYTEAVDWLAENGLTTGVSPGRWDPDTISSRAVAITFMYRMAYADALGGQVVVHRR